MPIEKPCPIPDCSRCGHHHHKVDEPCTVPRCGCVYAGEPRTRFGVTCIGIDGNRKLAVPAQARHLYDRREDAEEWLRACLAQPDNLDRLRQIHGPQAMGTFRVDPFDCWEHGDPKGVFVHDSDPRQ